MEQRNTTTCDGTRKRRFSLDKAKREWYALHRARRWAKRFFNVKG